MTDRPPDPAATRRWGMRTLGFLVLALVSIVVPSLMRARGVQLFNLVGFLGLVVGFVGAGVCTVRGLRTFRRTGPY